jgi:hypothetical protein
LTANAVRENVPIAVLTNGITWWFYLPHLNDGPEDKKFHAIDIKDQTAGDITQNLSDFLGKQNVLSGKAVKTAERIYRAKVRALIIKESLPKAWKKLMDEPQKWLFEILADVTKELCGYKPDKETVEQFIASEMDARADISAILVPGNCSQKEVKKAVQEEDYTGKAITFFTFQGTKYEVNSWNDMLLRLCETIAKKHRDDFSMVMTLSGRNKEYFSTSPYELLHSELIKGTDMYVDLDLSDMGIVALSHQILHLFGYDKNDLSFEAK